MSHKKQKALGPTSALRRDELKKAVQFSIRMYDTTSAASGQPFQLSPDYEGLDLSVDSLSRLAFLAGELGCYYLRKLPKRKKPKNKQQEAAFNEPFFQACLCLGIEDFLLFQACELENYQEAGQ